jgi:hypothetical protein
MKLSDLDFVSCPLIEAARLLGIGRTTAFAEVRGGRLKTFLVGRRRLVTAQALFDFVGERETEAAQLAAGASLDSFHHRLANKVGKA